MVTAAVAGAFRVLVEIGFEDVQRGLEMLNREVLRVAKGKYHMTMTALEIDEKTGRWVLCNAGAPPMLTLNQSGKHAVHFCPGSPLGTEFAFEVGFAEGILQPSERMLVYTDGIPEISQANGKVFGMRRLAQVYERTRTQHVRDAAAAIVGQADHWQAGTAQGDDWTFAMIEWGGP
jgi:serine phosphatase RsbU (regulator of sigma subunit)